MGRITRRLTVLAILSLGCAVNIKLPNSIQPFPGATIYRQWYDELIVCARPFVPNAPLVSFSQLTFYAGPDTDVRKACNSRACYLEQSKRIILGQTWWLEEYTVKAEMLHAVAGNNRHPTPPFQYCESQCIVSPPADYCH